MSYPMARENKFKNYTIKFKASADKDLKKLDKETQAKINDILTQLIDNPVNVDVKKMQGLKNTYRIRKGKFRIIFQDHNLELIVLVIEIGLRGDIY